MNYRGNQRELVSCKNTDGLKEASHCSLHALETWLLGCKTFKNVKLFLSDKELELAI